jgi:Lar family restriction alleviation protein
MTELKPCPFCGGEAETGYAINDYNRWGVICKCCGASVEVEEWKGVEDTEGNAIAAWNRRAGDDNG